MEDKLKETIKYPVTFHKGSGMFFDADNNHFADIRGWGFIQYLDNPQERQDALGEEIAKAMNTRKERVMTNKSVERLAEVINKDFLPEEGKKWEYASKLATAIISDGWIRKEDVLECFDEQMKKWHDGWMSTSTDATRQALEKLGKGEMLDLEIQCNACGVNTAGKELKCANCGSDNIHTKSGYPND